MLYQYNKDNTLYKALKENETAKVWQIVNQKNFNINLKDQNGQTALHIAAKLHSSDECILALLEKGALVNAIDNNKNTPLHIAAMEGNYTAVIYLLERNASTTLENNKYETPAEAANSSGRYLISNFIKNFGLPAAPKNKEFPKTISNAMESPVPITISNAIEEISEKTIEEEYPKQFECSISFEMMTDPVTTPHGTSYERKNILDHIKRKATDPVTDKPLTEAMLTPNRALKEMITEWEAKKEEKKNQSNPNKKQRKH